VSGALCSIVLRSQGSDYSLILRGLNKGWKKEIYFCNKAKMFPSFLLILMHVLHRANSRSLKEAFDFNRLQIAARSCLSRLKYLIFLQISELAFMKQAQKSPQLPSHKKCSQICK